MLRFLQFIFFLLLAIAIAAFSAWRYFVGGGWWLAALGSVLAYGAILSGVFLGSRDAWYGKVIRSVFNLALSSKPRAGASVLFIFGIAILLCSLAYKEQPLSTDYYEVRVFEKVDLPTNYQIGAKVILHTRTDGLTHEQTVAEDGAAIFRMLSAPTTLVYQVEVPTAIQPFMTGGSLKINSLPDKLDIDIAEISSDKKIPLPAVSKSPVANIQPRTDKYLANVDEQGDKSLQVSNAPWGVPRADIVINRLGYVLGYDPERRMPRWVAYSIGATDQKIPRDSRFIADPAIAKDKQATRLDYRTREYDRGHMISPSDLYFKGPVVVAEAYYMSTVAPQNKWLNRGLWYKLEQLVRNKVKETKQQAYILAGPLFIPPDNNINFKFKTIGEGEIPVPTHFYRITTMFTENGGVDTFAVLVPNSRQEIRDVDHYLVTIEELEKISGLKFLPLLNKEVADRIKARKNPVWQ